MNSEHAALQLKIEYSRKGKRSGKKKDFQHLTHTWMEEMVKKTIVYNTKKEKKEGDTEKRLKKRKRKKKGKKVEEIQQQKEEFSTLSHSTRACPRILSVYVRV